MERGRPTFSMEGRRKRCVIIDGSVPDHKRKIRPVLDFRDLAVLWCVIQGQHNRCVCDEKMGKWKHVMGGTGVVNLRSAYLQLAPCGEGIMAVPAGLP